MWKDSPSASRLPWLAAVTAAWLLPTNAWGVPGDVLFSDDFERNSLAPWTASNGRRAGIASGGQVSNSPTRGGYTRRNVVTVTSPTFAAAVPAAELTLWVRRGSDAFSELPDGGENLVLEYRRSDGSWGLLREYLGGETAGEIFNETFQLPGDALHGTLAVRLRQTGGSNSNFDWWHFDDVVVTETAPAAVLGIGSCDDFESGLAGNWSVNAGSGFAGVSNATSQSPFFSMTLNGGTVDVTSIPVDTGDPSFGQLTLWVQRGSDAFSEYPDFGENLVVEYLDDGGAWVVLETFTGGGPAGQTFSRSYAIPAAGRHAGFRLRFRHTGGSGPPYDYWHVDDVCFEQRPMPSLQMTKLVQTISDPVNGTTNPKAIPGAVLRYTIQVANAGPGPVDGDSLDLSDAIPAGTALLVDAGGPDAIVFTDGPVSSGLSFDFATDVAYSNQAGGAGPYDYTPTPDGQGFDPAVTGMLLSPTGAMNASAGSGDPSFRIEFSVRVQ